MGLRLFIAIFDALEPLECVNPCCMVRQNWP